MLVKLSTLLQSHGDPILRQESQLCLTATSLVFLNHCFEIINSGQQGTSEEENKQRGISYRDKEAITFLLDFLRRTPSLRLVQGNCPHFDGLIDISCFRALQVLEIKKVPVGFIRGFQSLRPQLKTLICRKSLISLNEVLVHCGGDQLNAPFAWPHLEYVDLSYNGIGLLDDSVKLLPKLKVLNLSHNNIHNTEEDDSHSLQYLSEVQHLNLGFNQMESIPMLPPQAGVIKFQMTTLILKNNNLQNLKGIGVFSNLRLLDVSFNCIASLSELTPLAHLHNLISLNLQGNPVVFCDYYRRATIACLYPVPRVEPIQVDGKCLDSEEQILLGRNVYPVSMLSYIPETPVPHPRVKAVKKLAEDLMETSESQEESDATPKQRKSKRKGKKGKRLVAREIDFVEDSTFASPSEDQSTTPCPTPTKQILEHAEDVEKLKKLRQLGGEGWLPSIAQVVPDEVVSNPCAESPVDQAASIARTESVPSFSDDKMDISSRTSSFSIMSDEDFSEAQHFLVTLMSTPEDDDGSAVPLFVTVKDEFVVEKNYTGKVITELETSCLQDVWVDRREDDHTVIHLKFDYINPDRQTRDYVMESHEDSLHFAETLKPFVTANKEMKQFAAERLQCLRCSAEFTRPVNSEDLLCPDCGSSMTVLVSSPNQNTALVNMPSSSYSTSSYVEAADLNKTQELEKTDNSLLTEDIEQGKNVPVTEKSPDVIPRTIETLDETSNIPDLCSNASDNVCNENGKQTSSQTENTQKKFFIENSGRFKVASNNEKYSLTKKTIGVTQVRTSALSYSLKESKFYKSPQTADSPSNKHVDDSEGLSPSRRKSAEDVIDRFPSTPPDQKLRDSDRKRRDSDRKLLASGRYWRDSNRKLDSDGKLRDSNRKLRDNDQTELFSQSLPAYENLSSNDSSARKHSEQRYSSAQRKISQNSNTDRGTPKTSDNALQQPVLSTGLSRSPTPKTFFNNLLNRLSGRLSGSGNSPSSSADSRTSSSSSSRASTPTVMEQNVALSFRLSVDEFSSCDHKLKLYFEVSLFRWGNHEEFRCLLKAPVVVYGSTEETPALMITSNVMFYLCRFSLKGSGTPDECLTPLMSHPLDDLQFIDSGLGGQSFRVEFSRPGGCYEFLVREKDRCKKFLNLFIDTVQQAKIKAGSKPTVINPPHPQTLEHIRSQVFGYIVEDPCLMGERLRQQVMNFTAPPLVKDRKSLLRSYSNCFVGREFVDWMLQVREAESRDEAVEIGQRLLDAGALEHVSKEQQFEDKDQYYRFNTETDLLRESAFAGDSVPDMDSNIVLFIMAHRCTDTTKPHTSLDAVSVVVTRSHIAVVKQNPQWPVPRYTEMPPNPKGPAFVCLARHKITDVTSLDFYEDDPCFMGISITDEDAPVDCAESQWILKTETVSTLSSLVKVIKDPWERQFNVELQKNLCPSIMEHKM